MKETRQTYEVWNASDGATLATTDQIPGLKKHGIIEKEATLIHVFEAATWEEANAIYNLRMGMEPYKPGGLAKKCPKDCGAYYYPDGNDSGECPYCG